MAIRVEVKLTGIEVLTRSDVINAMKRALRLLGEYWHDAFAWKRFTKIGYSEYRFRPRTAKYDKYKLRHLGHNDPLVLKGEARAEALSESTKQRIRVTRDTVTIPLPTKLNRYNPKGPNMAEEVRAVSRAEIGDLEDALVVFIPQELDRAVPPHLRNRGETGGRVKSLRLIGSRNQRIVEPIPARRAA
jgi:hypothetical protein